jgi:peptide-methionine (S)-S-oxide reductase
MTSYVLGGGCFWCLDAVYRRVKGVTKVETGYAGGDGPANYYRVATGETGYAEVARITFDETIIPTKTILDIYFLIHNPTTLNRQGNDVGTQYRSTMFYTDELQMKELHAAFKRAEKIWEETIVTQIEPLDEFLIAEDEQQDYFNKNPAAGYCSIIIAPKIAKARAAFSQWLKEE